jgi:hypothetical protein
MSLYVDPENQKLLWGIINTNPYLTNIFAKYHPSQKATWFKSVIEHFYNQYQDKNINELELHQMNKDTLAYMIQLTQQIPPLGENHLESSNISPIAQPFGGGTGQTSYMQPQYQPVSQQQHQQQQQMPQYQPPPSPGPPQQQMPQYQLPPPPPQQQIPQYQNQYNPIMNSQQHQQQYQAQQPMTVTPSQTQFYSPPMPQQQHQPSPQFQPYQEYRKPQVQQQEYQPMFDRKKPEQIDFSEKIEDGVITNMDDLIQKHMREREEELRMAAAMVQQQMVQPVQLPPLPPPPPRREMNEFNEANENIKAVIEPIVSEVNNNNMEVLSAQVLELKDIILLLRQEVKGLREKMEERLEEKVEEK